MSRDFWGYCEFILISAVAAVVVATLMTLAAVVGYCVHGLDCQSARPAASVVRPAGEGRPCQGCQCQGCQCQGCQCQKGGR